MNIFAMNLQQLLEYKQLLVKTYIGCFIKPNCYNVKLNDINTLLTGFNHNINHY